MPIKHDAASGRDTDRKYAVSANRTESRHRVRYVETGGAAVDAGECTFCDTTPVLADLDGESSEQPGAGVSRCAVPQSKATDNT